MGIAQTHRVTSPMYLGVFQASSTLSTMLVVLVCRSHFPLIRGIVRPCGIKLHQWSWSRRAPANSRTVGSTWYPLVTHESWHENVGEQNFSGYTYIIWTCFWEKTGDLRLVCPINILNFNKTTIYQVDFPLKPKDLLIAELHCWFWITHIAMLVDFWLVTQAIKYGNRMKS